MAVAAAELGCNLAPIAAAQLGFFFLPLSIWLSDLAGADRARARLLIQDSSHPETPTQLEIALAVVSICCTVRPT